MGSTVSSTISTLVNTLGSSLLCLFIDYGLYFAADVLYARRQLAGSNLTETNQNAVWRRLCGLLLACCVPIHLAHHRPLVLYLLISATFLITLRLPFDQCWQKLMQKCPVITSLGQRPARLAMRIIGALVGLSVKLQADFVKKQHNSKPRAPSTVSSNPTAFRRVQPASTTTNHIYRNENHFGIQQRSPPTATPHQKQSLLLIDRSASSKDYSNPAEEEDSLLTNGSLLHPPRRSFLKTSTPVDAAGSKMHHLRA